LIRCRVNPSPSQTISLWLNFWCFDTLESENQVFAA
jgi:hypothetical protein